MTHPEELLAAYVDGTASAEERAEVEAHLGECPACAEELELAGRAREALSELSEVPVPLGVTEPIEREIGAGARARRGGGMRWYQAATALAAAAAVIGLALVTFPGLRGGEGGGEPAQAPAAQKALEGDGVPALEAASGEGALVRRSKDYDEEAVQKLASSLDMSSGAPAEAQDHAERRENWAPELERPLACLEEGAELGATDRLTRVIQARFKGTPAYLFVVLKGPADAPPTGVAVWILATDDCRLLSFAERRA